MATKKEAVELLRKKIITIEKEKEILEEKLQLHRTRWLYAHHSLSSILSGLTLGIVVACIVYLLVYSLRFLSFIGSEIIMGLFLLSLLAVPTVSFILFIGLVKAPKLAFKSYVVYAPAFLFFQALFIFADPLGMFNFTPLQDFSSRLNFFFPIIFYQGFLAVFATIVVILIASKCGYRIILNGSAFAFKVNCGIDSVSKQLEKLGEDFTFLFDRSLSEQNRLYFIRGTNLSERVVLQAFLTQEGDETEIVLVMHSIENDIPMRAKPDDLARIGNSLMKWIEVSTKSTGFLSKNEDLITQKVDESKKSFHRRPVKLPSKKASKEFAKQHWKDILIIISTLATVIAILR